MNTNINSTMKTGALLYTYMGTNMNTNMNANMNSTRRTGTERAERSEASDVPPLTQT